MRAPRIIVVVEGHGDVVSIPVVVRRVAESIGLHHLEIPRPLRVPRNKIVRDGELERAVQLAALKLGDRRGGILVVLDADDDLPCELGPDLLVRSRAARADVEAAVVIANREKEAWFLASVESLRGHRGVPSDAIAPDDPEAIRDAKGWIKALTGRPYSEVTDQAALAATFDLDAAERGAPSFAKFRRDVVRLLERGGISAGGE